MWLTLACYFDIINGMYRATGCYVSLIFWQNNFPRQIFFLFHPRCFNLSDEVVTFCFIFLKVTWPSPPSCIFLQPTCLETEIFSDSHESCCFNDVDLSSLHFLCVLAYFF